MFSSSTCSTLKKIFEKFLLQEKFRIEILVAISGLSPLFPVIHARAKIERNC